MLRDPLKRAKRALIISAGHRGARHKTHIRHLFQLCCDLRCPICPASAANFIGFTVQAAAKAAVFIGKDHFKPRARCAERGHQTRRTSADHQKIAKRKSLLIAVGIRCAVQSPKPGRTADQRLIYPFPKGFRPHEGFVIKTGRYKRRGQIIYRQKIIIQTGPAVLALCFKPVIKLLLGGADIGVLASAPAQGDQGVRLFATRRQNPARAVVFKGPADQTHIIGQQRRGQSIPCKSAIADPVKAKLQRPAAINLTCAFQSHALAPFALGCASANSAPSTSWVSVFRRTTSQRPHPAS